MPFAKCQRGREKLERGSARYICFQSSRPLPIGKLRPSFSVLLGDSIGGERESELTASPQARCFPSAAVSRLKSPRHTSQDGPFSLPLAPAFLSALMCREKLHARIPLSRRKLADVRISEFNLGNMLSLLETLARLPPTSSTATLFADPLLAPFPQAAV